MFIASLLNAITLCNYQRTNGFGIIIWKRSFFLPSSSSSSSTAKTNERKILQVLHAFQDFSEPSTTQSLTFITNTKNQNQQKCNGKQKVNNTTVSASSNEKGKITMVGAGPGDPDLLTMSAYNLLSSADSNNKLVISDRLVSKEILDLVHGEIKVANKHPGCAEIAQEEIYNWVDEGLKVGRHVVRLKIGDPFVFGRGGEEVLRFRSMGYEPVVIPGVSASLSAPLLGGIPITHRGISNQVVMCTGYGRNGTSPDLIQYHKEQTVVLLMAVGRLREICQNLCQLAGYPSKTPVAIVENASSNQRTIIGNLMTIADIADSFNVKAPSTIVVGECVHVLLEDFGMKEKFVSGLIMPAYNHFIAET